MVTGGAGHIGREIATMLADLGATVVILDNDCTAMTETVAEITKHGGKAEAYELNLADIGQVRASGPDIERVFGSLDILVNGAALVGTTDLTGWVTTFEEQSPETWDQAFAVNLRAPFFLVQSCLAALRRSNHASIVNLSSIYGELGPDWRLYEGTSLGNPGAYAASKGGLTQMTRWMATTLAPDIRVNAVSIGGVWRNQPESFVKRYTARTPMQRMAVEQDIAGAVAFLAGDLAAYITGQVVAIDGGWSAW